MPVSATIFSTAARMSQLIRRAPSAPLLGEAQQANMRRIEDCVDCGACASRCPYNLDTPKLLRKCYEDYKRILSGEISVN